MTIANEIRAAAFAMSQRCEGYVGHNYLTMWKEVMRSLALEVEELERHVVPPSARGDIQPSENVVVLARPHRTGGAA